MPTRRKAVLSASLLVALLFVTVGLAYACGSRGSDHKLSQAELKSVIDGALKSEPNILGTIVRVDFEDGQPLETATGYLDPARTIPLTPDDRFLIGSITKTFTATLVLQLVEKGQVGLQDPLISHLSPEWSAILDQIKYGRSITVKQALRHRSGIADFTDSEEFWNSLVHDTSKKWTPIEVLARVRDEGHPKFRPGTAFDYCNTNYILLGALIENVSGRPYAEVLQSNILDPLELDHTFLLRNTLGSSGARVAHGYSTIDGRLRDGRDVSVDWAMAAGGLVSNTADLSRFFSALRNGDLFEGRDTFSRMIRCGPGETYGRGLEVTDDPDIGLHYGHKGSFLDTRAIVAYFPKQQITVTVCLTYTAFTMTAPEDLMKAIVRRILGLKPIEEATVVFEGPDLFGKASNVRVNDDRPTRGEWDFATKEEWTLDRVGPEPFIRPSRVAVDADGKIYLLDRGTAKVFVLDRAGHLLYSFGEIDDIGRVGLPLDIYVTNQAIHVVYMGNTKDTIISYDRNGTSLGSYEIERGISPRGFVDTDRYLAVRSSADVLKRPKNELLELLSLKGQKGAVLGKFTAEDKMVLTTIVPRGRIIHLQDEIELFPRLIVHLDGDTLFVGRSDKYLIEKLDLDGAARLAFSLEGRRRRPLPANYASDLADRTKLENGKPMPAETRERFIAGFPRAQTYFTKISTDENGLVYVFVPDILNPGSQEIDIFSFDGVYLHRAVIRLPEKAQPVSPPVFDGDHLLALVKDSHGDYKLIRYGIQRPVAGATQVSNSE